MSAAQDTAVQSSGSSSNNTPAPSASASSATSTGNSSSAAAAAADNTLVCLWEGCSDRFPAAEQLYEHLCERHVGRKSTNNLNTTCKWNGCGTTCVKRDHITSHIRVHVPLKPHRCDFCGKSFKRSQDLKKHVKTHADDSVLVGRSGPEANGGGGGMNAFRGHPHAHAPKAPPSYYDHNGHMRPNSAAYGQPPNGAGYYGHHPAQAYQPMYTSYQPTMGGRGDFLTHHAAAAPPSFDSRKRGFDELNDFFGALKSGQVNPRSYNSVGRALLPVHGTSFGVQASGAATAGGGGGVATQYMPAPAPAPTIAAGHGPMTQHYYLPPMPNIRTKEDLRDIDHILQQMQATVYENSGSPSSENPQYVPVDMRHSSPSYARPAVESYATASLAAAQAASPASVASSSQSNGTPALTPPASTMSYTSGHSPTSSSALLSPSSRPNSTSIAYPSLPAVTHPQANLAGLGTSFTAVERRLSGGVLQSASVTPRPPPASKDAETAASSPSGDSDGSDAETYDTWLGNMRLLEALRSVVQDLLKGRGFDGVASSDRPMSEKPKPADGANKSLYPDLPGW